VSDDLRSVFERSPTLLERLIPRLTAVSTLSEPSRREQGAEAEASVLRELMTLQAQYERAFGFRFVVFVAGRSKEQLLPVLRERLTRSRHAELRAGIDAFLAISLDRLRKARAEAR